MCLAARLRAIAHFAVFGRTRRKWFDAAADSVRVRYPNDTPPGEGAGKVDPGPETAEPQVTPLTDQQRQALSEADRRCRKATRAAGVAAFNGWFTAVFAALCAPFAPFSITALLMGCALGVIAFNEFRGRRLIRALDLRGPRRLGWNQVGMMAVVIVYALFQIYAGLTGASPYQAHIASEPQLAEMLGSIDELQRFVVLAVYVTVIVLTIVFQGGNALYYFTRTGPMRAYLAQTPPWVLEIQRERVQDRG